jgi:hypothetical protein
VRVQYRDFRSYAASRLGLYKGESDMKYWNIVDGKPVQSDTLIIPGAKPTPGVGDVVAGATKAVGIKPCGACQKRQAALNRATPGWVGKILSWFKG